MPQRSPKCTPRLHQRYLIPRKPITSSLSGHFPGICSLSPHNREFNCFGYGSNTYAKIPKQLDPTIQVTDASSCHGCPSWFRLPLVEQWRVWWIGRGEADGWAFFGCAETLEGHKQSRRVRQPYSGVTGVK
jgi:hypothetical protein